MLFYLDEDLSDKIAQIARSRGLDVTSAHETGRRGYSDDTQLLLAAQEGRCVVTKNGAHYLRETRTFMTQGLPHAGVLVVSASLASNQFAAIATALVHYHEMHPQGVPPYFFDYLHPA